MACSSNQYLEIEQPRAMLQIEQVVTQAAEHLIDRVRIPIVERGVFHNKYRPQFYLRTMDCTGEITLPEGTEMVMPGDNVEITVELIYPVALNVGLRFAIREGGRTVGSGQITEIID